MPRKQKTVSIAGYARISNDDNLGSESTTIETQKSLMQEYVNKHFPNSDLSFYEDRDISGYTFEQRPGYQKMRKNLVEFHEVMILNDLSRFARRNGRGLVELEDLRDMGIRIISISEGIDYPAKDDWLAIQIYFFVNEMPVTQTSKKVRNIIAHRQRLADWICSAPYGYRIVSEAGKRRFQPDAAAIPVIQMIFKLYSQGWGYAKIAKHLTDMNLPTPTMLEKERVESDGSTYNGTPATEWSPISISGILQNDFYIGTFRTKKYGRTKINGKDKKLDKDQHNVFERHHEAVIDDQTFLLAQREREARGNVGYRGVKKYNNYYSGLIFCGDCQAPMFAMSRKDLKPAYTCGTYHRHGRKGCTSHHTRIDTLDTAIKAYVTRLRNGSESLLHELEKSIAVEETHFLDNADTLESLDIKLQKAKDELKETQRAKIRAIVKNPGQEELVEDSYAEIETELIAKIDGLQNQALLITDSQNALIQTNRIARSVIEVFDSILQKETLSRKDVNILIQRITVYTDHIDIQLYPDIDQLLSATIEETAANFKLGSIDIESETAAVPQSSRNRRDKVYTVNIVRDGDPLEIYTDKDGGVIFRKYSLMGGLSEFSAQLCETLHKTTGRTVIITDRDSCLSVAGGAKKILTDQRISSHLEHIMEERQIYRQQGESDPIPVSRDSEEYCIETAAPIISEGDVLGCVVFSGTRDNLRSGEIEVKLAQTIASFLGKHMES